MNDENKCSGLNCPMQIGFNSENCKQGNGCPFFTAKADELTVTAIAKQIPMIVTPEQRYYGIGRCPRCDVVFTDSSTKYCGNCGQRVLFNENVSRET